MEAIRTINNDIQLVYDGSLHFLKNGQKVLSNFNELGELINGLLPVYFKENNLIKYFDVDTNTVYNFNDVDWVSGFHYVGNELNHLFHNYRSSPLIKETNSQYTFQSDLKEIHQLFEGKEGIEIMPIKNRSFDYDKQIFIESSSNKYEYIINHNTSIELFDSIKYIRIAGKGNLNLKVNLSDKPFVYDGKPVYSPKHLMLSKNSEQYGVIDVRTNKVLLDFKYKKINVLPKLIVYENEAGVIECVCY
jgi:hypothetical protein